MIPWWIGVILLIAGVAVGIFSVDSRDSEREE